jgi:hypothetical protein
MKQVRHLELHLLVMLTVTFIGPSLGCPSDLKSLRPRTYAPSVSFDFKVPRASELNPNLLFKECLFSDFDSKRALRCLQPILNLIVYQACGYSSRFGRMSPTGSRCEERARSKKGLILLA